MTLNELDIYFNSFLHRELFPQDPSRNGIQITNSDPKSKQISKAAFAVDACLDSMQRAAKAGAQLLFVHHGLFWGDCQAIDGIHYKRIAFCLSHDIALYASHIPLDANKDVGNNYGLARRLNLKELQPFGKWRGMTIGVMGRLPVALDIEELACATLLHGQKPSCVLPFGKQKIETVAIISGGAGADFNQALEAGADAYITGEIEHEQYHPVKEAGINVIAAGHYQTEIVGVNLLRQKLEAETHMETVFIDIPTGL